MQRASTQDYLSVGLDHSLPMARVDFVAAESAKFDPERGLSVQMS